MTNLADSEVRRNKLVLCFSRIDSKLEELPVWKMSESGAVCVAVPAHNSSESTKAIIRFCRERLRWHCAADHQETDSMLGGARWRKLVGVWAPCIDPSQ